MILSCSHISKSFGTDVILNDVSFHIEDYENGYLTISTSKGLDKDEKDEQGHYIRQERYVGNMSRSFYLGDIPKEDIKAKYEGGVLRLSVPKSDMKQIENTSTISIE